MDCVNLLATALGVLETMISRQTIVSLLLALLLGVGLEVVGAWTERMIAMIILRGIRLRQRRRLWSREADRLTFPARRGFRGSRSGFRYCVCWSWL